MDILDVITGPSMQTPYAMLMGLLFSVLPISMGYLLIGLNVVLQFSDNIEVAVIVGSVLLLVMLFYGRLGGRERWLLIFMLLGFYLGVPYVVPLIAGLYFGVQSVFPIAIGVFLWEFYPLALELVHVERPRADTIVDIPDSFGQVFAYAIDMIAANDQWVAMAFVFALVTLVVFAASKMNVDFSKEIAIVLGVVINVVSFIFLQLAIDLDVNIMTMIFASVFSGILVFLIKFFDVVLNYQRAERVEFEDDENYYFVRVVPKMAIAKKEHKIRKVRGNNRDVHTDDELDAADEYVDADDVEYDDLDTQHSYDDYDPLEEYEADGNYDDEYDDEYYDDDEHEDRRTDRD